MGATKPSVKGNRTYDGSRRQEQARRQHAATLDAARELFLERGFVATTVEEIAVRSRVSAATIYKSYGGKRGVVRELCQRALAGAGPVPAETRSDALRSSGDPAAVIEGWGQLMREVAPRLSPLLLLLRAAALSDPDAAALEAEIDKGRLDRMADNARFLARGGHLRPGVSAREAKDVLWTCSAPELYDLLVRRRGWSVARYARFATDTMKSALL